jgi:hypothetical protein
VRPIRSPFHQFAKRTAIVFTEALIDAGVARSIRTVGVAFA